MLLVSEIKVNGDPIGYSVRNPEENITMVDAIRILRAAADDLENRGRPIHIQEKT